MIPVNLERSLCLTKMKIRAGTQIRRVLFILGTLRSNDATATRTLLEMRICIKKKAQKEKSNFVVACFYSLIAKLGIFTLWSGKNRKEMYKKSVMHVRSCCFAY